MNSNTTTISGVVHIRDMKQGDIYYLQQHTYPVHITFIKRMILLRGEYSFINRDDDAHVLFWVCSAIR
jgi:hypothetical protein